MAGTTTRVGVAVAAGLMILASSLPASAQRSSRTVFVAGSRPGVAIRSTADGMQRQVTVPGLAALRRARNPEQARDAWLAHVQQMADAAAPPTGRQVSDAYPVPDLNGDQRRDVIVVRSGDAGLQYAAVGGSSGDKLWSVDSALTTAQLYGDVFPLRGSDAKGVLLATTGVEESSPADAAWVLQITTELTAVSGDGTARWTKTYRGSITFSDAGAVFSGLGYPAAIGPINGEGSDVAVRVEDSAYSLHAGGVTRIEVLDGASGTPSATIQSAGAGEAPGAGVVGDLNGDKLRDVVLASSAGDQVAVVAYSGVSGMPIWRNSLTGAPVYYIESTGRTDDDSVDDLLLTGINWESEQFFVSTLASGSDGNVRWQGLTDGALPLRDISGDGRADVLAVYALFGAKKLGIRYTAITGGGQRIYDRFHGVQPSGGSGFGGMGMWAIGDVDADGNVDFGHDVSWFGFDGSGGTAQADTGVVLANTGRKAFSGPAADGLYASVDRKGDDLVRMVRTAEGVRLVVRDGRTNQELWRRSLAIDGYRVGFARGGDLTGDGVAELLVMSYRRGGTTGLSVIDGRTRVLRWRR